MNNTIKTSIAASLALLISFTMLFAYLGTYSTGNQTNTSNEKIVPDISGEKRVFLIGSSYVERLNATYIQQYLSENGLQQFHVYNIAKNGAGNPSQQSAFLEPILSARPTLIVYGLGFRELGYKPYTDNVPKCTSYGTSYSENTTSASFSTPSIQDAITYVQNTLNLQTDYFANIPDPKHVTVDLLKSSFSENSTSLVGGAAGDAVNQTLFEKKDPIFTEIKSLDEINKPLDYTVHVCPQDVENELGKLDEMVSAFEKHNIKVVLFVPPFSSSYLNAVGSDGTHAFLSALEKFSDKNKLQLYDMHDKYVKLNIWADAQHVAQNSKVVVYSDDLAKIILNQLQSFKNMRTVDTSGNDLSHKDLSNADLRSVDLSGKNMTGATLEYSNLFGANVSGTILKGANLSHAYLRDIDLSENSLAGTILTGADLTGANLDGVDLSNKDLTGANLGGADLRNTNLEGTVLTGANLDYSNLGNVDLTNKNLTGSSLKGVYLSGKDLTGTLFIGSNLAYANLRGNDLTGKNLTGASMYGTNLADADLAESDLAGVDLRKTILTGTNLDDAKLYKADLSGNGLINTTMTGADLRDAVLRGANLAGKDLTGTNLDGANLRDARLTGVDLTGKNLSGANLGGADLNYATLAGVNLGMKDLTGASLHGADLTKAILWKAKLIRVNLADSNLSHSDLRNTVIQNSNLADADLSGANLSGANLAGDNLRGTVLAGANLANANLTGVDLSRTVTTPVVKLTHVTGYTHAQIITNFQSESGWLKQSSSGSQSYDTVDHVNGSQSLKLVTDGAGSPTVTHSNMMSPPLDLSHTIVSAWIKIDNPSKVKQMWMYFSSDGLKSSWYTSKISSHIKPGQWVKVSVNPKDFVTTGSPDLSEINRLQIRIADDSTGPVTLHINEISLQREVAK